MLRNEKFEYKALEKITRDDGVRHYRCLTTNLLVPSATTIIDATEDKSGLLEWRKRVGDEEADRIKNEACALGSLMHNHIENHVSGIPRPGGSNLIRMQAKRMADRIIEEALPFVDEVWGQEVMLCYPGLYAGTTDLCGIYKGKEAIMDHKTARKMKKLKDIIHYRDQLCFYLLAHNETYGTNINTGVIFMVDRQLNFQEFYFDENDIKKGIDAALRRLELYYKLSK